MGAIAEGRPLGVLAITKCNRLGLGQDMFHGRKLAPRMRAVAEGLIARLATGAPVIGARLEFEHGGTLGGNVRFTHTP